MNIHSGIVNIDSTPITNGYVPEKTISEGRVFVLTKARCGTKYVILKTTRTQDAIHQEILRREYEIGKSLSHGCVVSTIDFSENTPVGAAIVLEYIDGVTLVDRSDPIEVIITSTGGNVFKNGTGTDIKLVAKVYQGGTEVDTNSCSYEWTQYDQDGLRVSGSNTVTGEKTQQVTVTPSMVNTKATFWCKVTYPKATS